MTEAELIVVVKRFMKAQQSELTDDDYADAVDRAEAETWALPQTSAFRIDWLKKRTIRHLYDFLSTQSARKFRAGKFYLDQRFDHYEKLIKRYDKEFQEALDAHINEFANVNAYEMFGTKIDAGFSYNTFGEDTTYTSTNEVINTPNESS